MLSLYRAALRIRHAEPDLGDGPLAWVAAPADVLAFARGPDFLNLTNLSGSAVPLPPHRGVLLASADVADDHLPPDATVWLRPTPTPGGPSVEVAGRRSMRPTNADAWQHRRRHRRIGQRTQQGKA